MKLSTIGSILALVFAGTIAFLFGIHGNPQLGNTATSTLVATATPVDQGIIHAGPQELYPDFSLTPGATNSAITQDNISQNLCSPSWSTKSERPTSQYTTALKVKQLAAGYTLFGNSDPNTQNYEEDHLISLELGGNPTSEQNLWPESYNTTVNGVTIGAKQKDLTENYLHKQICAGTMTLAEAQNEIVTDWYAVYTQHVSKAAPTFGSTGPTDPDDN